MIDIRRLLLQILTTDHSNRRIAKREGCSPGTIGRYRKILQDCAVTREDVPRMSDDALLKMCRSRVPIAREFVEPNWVLVEAQLRRKGVDRMLLWDEYHDSNPPGTTMSYREFCRRLAKQRKRYGVVMRQSHLAGEKLFVDFMGGKPHWTDPKTGEFRHVEVFVACLGASNYIYAEAVPDQSVEHWVSAHINAFEAFGGSTPVLVPDNLKAAVLSRPKGASPVLNPAYRAMAEHYGAVVEPARPRHPQDKPLVELAVKFVHKALVAKLRRRTFFSREELNRELRAIVDGINRKAFAKAKDHSRRSLFEAIDKPALLPLPATAFGYRKFVVGKFVGPDYHVPFEGVSYSVPFTLVGDRVDVRVSDGSVEFWHNGGRVAIHAVPTDGSTRVTDPAHMPERHRSWREAEADRVSWVQAYGPNATEVVRLVSEGSTTKYHRQRKLRQLRDLARFAGPTRFEEACTRALELGAAEPRVIENLLRRGLERGPEQADSALPPQSHSNIRGSDYFRSGEDA